MEELTPMMQQYMEIKSKYNNCILFFRLGDFYEMFFEDAEIASKQLEITLTGRDCGLGRRAPMCGVPYHAVDSYIARLINKGYKVAVCEQMEDPSIAKGIVKRDIVRVITPGTVIDSKFLDDKKNNYVMSIYKSGYIYGISVADVSTGMFSCTQILWGNTHSKLIDEIAKYTPAEIIVNGEFSNEDDICGKVKKRFNTFISDFDDKYFDINTAKRKIAQHVNIVSKTGLSFKIEGKEMALCSAGALMEYLSQTQMSKLNIIRSIDFYNTEQYMVIDASTRRNLEITETLRDRDKKGSLLWVIDKTVTSIGARMLRKWIEQPLINTSEINKRLDAVREFKAEYIKRNALRESLKKVYDIERLMSKIVFGTANCRDLIALKNSIAVLPDIRRSISDLDAETVKNIHNNIDELTDVFELLERAIADDPPVTVKEGGIIKTGYDKEVDDLRNGATDGKNWIAALENKEREKTGIKNLKVGYNRVFGYYLDVTKSYYDSVPDYFIRKQTLANSERYITAELKEIEDKVLGAEERLIELEYSIFVKVRDVISDQVERIKTTAELIAVLDVLTCFAEVAQRNNYTMPEVNDEEQVSIKNGRHPVIEQTISENNFVPNDVLLNCDEDRVLIITGPNMAGKSTYMRQIALIVLMAQIGCFVPAEAASIGVCDRIFTRVGASDDISSGQSTFMVEMTEVANILKNATKRSLLIFDEVGRGTSTFDGLSIAWSVIEYVGGENIGAKTLFATHYHELTKLEGRISGVKNYCILVKEKGEDVIFLRKIVRGGADDSYGIQVAKLAGIPDAVISRAKQILAELEDADISKKENRIFRNSMPIDGQINLFAGNTKVIELIDEIKNINITAITPIEALNIVYNLQKKLQ